MEEEIVGGKFSIDISDLSKALSKANKYIALSNSEFKAATAGMDKWQDSADGLNAKIKNLTDVTELQRKKVEALQKEYNDLTDNGTKPATNASIDLERRINNEIAALKTSEKELKNCREALDNLTSSSNDTVNAYDKLTDEINSQEDELKKLKKEYANLALEQGESSNEANDLKRKIEELSSKLKDNKTKMKDAEKAASDLAGGLDDAGDGADDAGDGFSILKGSLSVFIGNVVTSAVSKIGELAGSLFELVEATKEYRSMSAKLEGSSKTFGYEAEFAEEKFRKFYGYLGDNQMATNAITNLMGLGTSTENLSKLADGAIGVWASYGDSIPIESLTEVINETIQVG